MQRGNCRFTILNFTFTYLEHIYGQGTHICTYLHDIGVLDVLDTTLWSTIFLFPIFCLNTDYDITKIRPKGKKEFEREHITSTKISA